MYSRNRERVIPVLEKTGPIAGSVLLSLTYGNSMELQMKTKIYFLLNEYGTIRSVGKTSKPLEERLKGHLKEARSGSKNHRCDWIRSMLRQGFTPAIELQTEVNGDGCKAEIAYIAYYRKKGFNLVNGTIGGDGVIGHHHSLATRRQIGLAGTGRRHTKETIELLRIICTGRKASDKTRQILSESHKGIHPSETTRRKLSLSHKGFPSPNKGKRASIETRIKMSISRKGKPTWNKGLSWTDKERQAHRKEIKNEKQ